MARASAPAYAEALLVPCPTCRAEEGKKCVDLSKAMLIDQARFHAKDQSARRNHAAAEAVRRQSMTFLAQPHAARVALAQRPPAPESAA